MRSRALLLLLAVGAALFAVTYFATRAFHDEQVRLAQQWADRGDAELVRSQPAAAVTDFRTALLYARDNAQYQFKLAKALAASGRTDEAQAYFKNLWESEPGNGTVNLELARLAAKKSDYADAVRYFHGAVFGLWFDEPTSRRDAARLELIHFLVQHHATAQADAELISLEAELPDNSTAHRTLADLFTQVQDYPRALDEYRRAVDFDRADVAALAGAGRAAFELAQYSVADQYLHAAVVHGSKDAAVLNLAETVQAIAQLDPYGTRLSGQERRARVMRAFDEAGLRLQQCAAANGQPLTAEQPNPNSAAAGQATEAGGVNAALISSEMQTAYQDWRQLRPRITERSLRRDPDLMDQAMNVVFRIERQAGKRCGPERPIDSALTLIARQRGEG